MDRLPVIARLQYETVAQFLINLFEQALTLYQDVISTTNTTGSITGISPSFSGVYWYNYYYYYYYYFIIMLVYA